MFQSDWPEFSPQERMAVEAILTSGKVNYWTGGEGRAFENEFAEFAESNYAIAVSNGTVAIDLIIKALDLPAKSEVIVTPRSFIASASTLLLNDLVPVFVDVDPDTQNITVENVAAAITTHTSAIICVHLNGVPCDMDPLLELAKDRSILVIEDCAQAHGARYKDRSVGSLGDAAAWSFCQDKIISSGGEGGMITTNNKVIWQRIWESKDHGKNYEKMFSKSKKKGFNWVHDSIGSNHRMTEIQSAIGRIQLSNMAETTLRRTTNASLLTGVLEQFSFIRIPKNPDYSTPAWYKYYCFVEDAIDTRSVLRDRIVDELNAIGIDCMQGCCGEIYRELGFDQHNYRVVGSIENSRVLFETSICFKVDPTLSDGKMQAICEKVKTKLIELSKEYV